MDSLNWILENPELVVTGLVTVCSAISAIVPSVGKFMKIVDALALNWNKARNDPNVQ